MGTQVCERCVIGSGSGLNAIHMKGSVEDDSSRAAASDRSRAAANALLRPSGPAPRGFSNWDADDGVWRNDEGETVQSKKERQAQAAREYRERKKARRLAQSEAQQLATSGALRSLAHVILDP